MGSVTSKDLTEATLLTSVSPVVGDATKMKGTTVGDDGTDSPSRRLDMVGTEDHSPEPSMRSLKSLSLTPSSRAEPLTAHRAAQIEVLRRIRDTLAANKPLWKFKVSFDRLDIAVHVPSPVGPNNKSPTAPSNEPHGSGGDDVPTRFAGRFCIKSRQSPHWDSITSADGRSIQVNVKSVTQPWYNTTAMFSTGCLHTSVVAFVHSQSSLHVWEGGCRPP